MSKKKPTQPPVLPASRDLVPVGPRHVQTKYQGKRDENGLKPSTSRALILRNGKFGARGTGEIMLAGRMSGREKLDLLAGLFNSVALHATPQIRSRGPRFTEITYGCDVSPQVGEMRKDCRLSIQWCDYPSD
jgi:hypothetical protein